jgi:hypothetical protein
VMARLACLDGLLRAGFEAAGRQGGRAAGRQGRRPVRAAARLEWSAPVGRESLKCSTILEGGRAAGRYELPLGWNGLLPLVAGL